MPVVRKKVIGRRTEYVRPEKLQRTLSLKEFYEKRNKILILRGVGGLGDILMHRMMFEDFKKLMPDAEIHFACPRMYHDAIADHPFIDKILDVPEAQKHEYIVHYNTTVACGRYEMRIAPAADKHRSDIWAEHCGLTLTNHDMHFCLTEHDKAEGRKIIEMFRDRPGKIVAFAPISAMQQKNLSNNIITNVVRGLQERGYYVFGLHKEPIYSMLQNDTPIIAERNLRKWLAIVSQIDYAISVDTAAFHCAGGMKKPTVGIFTFVNSKAYSQYYPNVELVQGPCPFNYSGCYNWTNCPELKFKKDKLIPCCLGLQSDNILAAFDKLVNKENI